MNSYRSMKAPGAVLAASMMMLLSAGVAAADYGTISGTVRDTDGAPVTGAVVRVAGGWQRATTGDDGRYSLELLSGSYRLLVLGQDYGVKSATVRMVSGDAQTMDFTLEETPLSQFGEQVVVLGSRAERTAIETAVPVDVLSSEDLDETGQTETSRKIQMLAPSFNLSTSTISDGSDIVRPSTLRGLGPDQTLVLINGKRRHNSALVHVNGSIGRGTAGVDLNAIPSSSIDGVEVLRDGAAAQYGSDAIAGVINVRLNSETGTTHVDVNAGQHYESDGATLQTSISRGWDVADGFVNVTLESRQRGYTDRSGLDPRSIFNFEEQVFGAPQLVDSDGDGICDGGGACTVPASETTYNRRNHRYGDADSDNTYVWVNSEVPIDDDWDFYLFGGISRRSGESAGFNRLPGQSRTNILLHPEGHLPLINTTVDDDSLAFGFRRTLADSWTMDLGLTNGRNSFDFNIANSANTSMGTGSPRGAHAGQLAYGQSILNVDFYGAQRAGSVPVALAFGVELREDRYDLDAGTTASYVDGGQPDQFGGTAPAGIQVFPGFRPSNEVHEDRNNVAVYGDVELDFSDQFLLGIAARFEDYSDFGNNVSGKIALRYEFVEAFALRGSASTGFRAPSLHQSHFNNISTQFVDVSGVLTPLEVGTFRVSDPIAQSLGARPLEEETSLSYSIGFTSRPAKNFSITADAFQIDIEDRIVLSGRFSAADFPQLGTFGVNAAQFFTNAIDTTTEGLDLVLAYAKRLSGGASWSLTAAGNWNKTLLDSPVRTPPELTGAGETLFNDIEITYLERGQPRQLYNLSSRYSNGRFSALARLNYFGSVQSTESATDPARKQTFSSKVLADLDVSWKFDNGATFAIGGNNILDEYPDENIASNSFNGIFIYPRRTAPFGFNGGYYYVRLGMDF